MHGLIFIYWHQDYCSDQPRGVMGDHGIFVAMLDPGKASFIKQKCLLATSWPTARATACKHTTPSLIHWQVGGPFKLIFTSLFHQQLNLIVTIIILGGFSINHLSNPTPELVVHTSSNSTPHPSKNNNERLLLLGDRLLRPRSLTTHGDRGMRRRVRA
jgi:hypothetical protein